MLVRIYNPCVMGAFQIVALMKNRLLSGLLRKLAMTIRVAVIARNEAIQDTQVSATI